jgi:hypothetical protein
MTTSLELISQGNKGLHIPSAAYNLDDDVELKIKGERWNLLLVLITRRGVM